MKKNKLFVALLISLLILSCNKATKPVNFDYGKIENGKYSNTFFGMEMELPYGWHFLTEEQNKGLMNSSSELLYGNDEQRKKTIDAAKITTTLLLTALQYEVETDSAFNPNIVILVENLKNNKLVKNEADYLRLTRKTLEERSITQTNDGISRININGVDFSVMKITFGASENEQIHQQYYTRLLKNFALTVILTYKTEDQRLVLEQAVNTLKFN